MYIYIHANCPAIRENARSLVILNTLRLKLDIHTYRAICHSFSSSGFVKQAGTRPGSISKYKSIHWVRRRPRYRRRLESLRHADSEDFVDCLEFPELNSSRTRDIVWFCQHFWPQRENGKLGHQQTLVHICSTLFHTVSVMRYL